MTHMKMYLMLLFILISSFCNTLCSTDTPQICSKCPSPLNSSYVREFCGNTNGDLYMNHSCCINQTQSADSAIIGLDMSSCGLATVDDLLNYMHNLKVLMLQNNPSLKLKPVDFKGLSNLQYLSLPADNKCPGGKEAWKSMEKENNTVICKEEINLCVQNNVTCPNNNSHCVVMAPGEMECLCNSGYHGYKCLRQGMFPYASYTTVICVCTVVIAGFLWCTQRRKVKKVHRQ